MLLDIFSVDVQIVVLNMSESDIPSTYILNHFGSYGYTTMGFDVGNINYIYRS